MKKKNIVFICTDQQRTDTMSCYAPDTLCQTPRLNELAAESIIFDNAYTSCPVCTPARSSMQTGFYPFKTGMETNSYQTGCAAHEICDVPYLLSRRLQSVGYQCGYTGKWHLGMGRDKTHIEETPGLNNQRKQGSQAVEGNWNWGTLPTDVGYIGDDFPGHGSGGWGYPQYQEYLKAHGLEKKIINITKNKRPGDHSTTGELITPEESAVEYFIVERAKAIIDELLQKDEPFYFQLNFWGPHEPYFAPTKYLDMYRDLPIPPNPTFNQPYDDEPKIYNLLRRPEQGWDFFENNLRHYYACTTFIDAQVGRLMDYLKEKGIYDDTMVIFTADHGDTQGCHGGLENKSYTMYDDTTKIPLLIKPAKKGYESYRQPAFVGTCDLYATILQEAGFEPHDEYGFCDGRPLNGFIADQSQPWSDEIVSAGMGAFPVVTTQRMYRKGKYKYVFNGAGEDQMFDMEADPLETVNLIKKPECRELVRSMQDSFADWMIQHKDTVWSSFCKINRLKQWS